MTHVNPFVGPYVNAFIILFNPGCNSDKDGDIVVILTFS